MLPSLDQIQAIPLVRAGEFELSKREVRRTRRLIYSLNKDGIRRYRTQREGSFLLVWRIK